MDAVADGAEETVNTLPTRCIRLFVIDRLAQNYRKVGDVSADHLSIDCHRIMKIDIPNDGKARSGPHDGALASIDVSLFEWA